ncbi:hypothetical protein QJS66_02145 [Kocuria rhizophila]|nr:hypothetical protein QJS66_02145 [Kocuria rhizophila]
MASFLMQARTARTVRSPLPFSAGLDYPAVGRSTPTCTRSARVALEAVSGRQAHGRVPAALPRRGDHPTIDPCHALAGARWLPAVGRWSSGRGRPPEDHRGVPLRTRRQGRGHGRGGVVRRAPGRQPRGTRRRKASSCEHHRTPLELRELRGLVERRGSLTGG